MPCDTIQRSAVNFKLDATNTELLKAALEGLGYTVADYSSPVRQKLVFSGPRGVEGRYENGTFTASVWGAAEEFDVNQVKRAYSKEVVKFAAKRFGWSMKEQGENKFQVQRRF